MRSVKSCSPTACWPAKCWTQCLNVLYTLFLVEWQLRTAPCQPAITSRYAALHYCTHCTLRSTVGTNWCYCTCRPQALLPSQTSQNENLPSRPGFRSCLVSVHCATAGDDNESSLPEQPNSAGFNCFSSKRILWIVCLQQLITLKFRLWTQNTIFWHCFELLFCENCPREREQHHQNSLVVWLKTWKQKHLASLFGHWRVHTTHTPDDMTNKEAVFPKKNRILFEQKIIFPNCVGWKN